jgi:23S rRNA pseudouridine955/2504/2580 synthase
MLRLITADDDDGRRLDRVLRKALPGLPLSALHRFLRKGKITVDGAPAEAAFRVRAGQLIGVPEVPMASCRAEPDVPAAVSSLEILREGDGFLILNKPAGIAVHGPGSLDEQVRAYLAPKLPASLSFTPGPLHRLDKPSSGVIVFSTSLGGARYFSALLKGRSSGPALIRKIYLAITDGTLESGETWEDTLFRDRDRRRTCVVSPVAGGTAPCAKARPALTRITPVASAFGRSLIRAEIETGRTHQIRAQAAAHGRPLSGDAKYGGKPFPDKKNRSSGFFLHSWILEFPLHPAGPLVRVEAPLPEEFVRVIREIFGPSAARCTY